MHGTYFRDQLYFRKIKKYKESHISLKSVYVAIFTFNGKDRLLIINVSWTIRFNSALNLLHWTCTYLKEVLKYSQQPSIKIKKLTSTYLLTLFYTSSDIPNLNRSFLKRPRDKNDFFIHSRQSLKLLVKSIDVESVAYIYWTFLFRKIYISTTKTFGMPTMPEACPSQVINYVQT